MHMDHSDGATRRAVLTRRLALLACLSIPLGSWRALKAQSGWLTIPLDQWTGLTIAYRGETIHLRAEDVFTILKGDDL